MRGFVDGGVFTFKGIPYGQNTGGENRWLPAKPPVPWKDEYPALIYGANCPQTLHDWTGIEQTFLQDWDDGYKSEDMLKLNIWTPSLTGKRAVMFYIHGGGFFFGSSYELPSHEGAQMARHHDVVQVSVNHRLNALGFLDVSEVGGSAYEDSVNRRHDRSGRRAASGFSENISNFGGDPDKVMIYGQSGGGSKVTTLLGMPSAKGLIHRASAQSGGGGNIPTGEQQKEFARQMIKELGIAPNDIGALQKMEWSRLIEAGNAAAAKMNPPGASGCGAAMPIRRVAHVWMPTAGWTHHQREILPGRCSRSFEGCAHADRLGERRGQPYALQAHRGGMACELAEAYRRSKATALIAGHEEGASGKSIRTLSYRRRRPRLPQQCGQAWPS